jgi:AcrR family transcriptional regulator
VAVILEQQGVPSGARARAREDAILDAALELLLEVGYDRLSMDAIAERAHAGKATIYRHFPDKAALVVSALARHHGQVAEAPDTGSLRGDLLEFGRRAASASGFDGGLFSGLLNASRSDEVLAGLLKEQMWDAKREALRRIITQAVSRGELADDAACEIVSEVCCAVVLHRLVVERLDADEEFRRRLVDEIALPLLFAHSGPATPAPVPPRRKPATTSSTTRVTRTPGGRGATGRKESAR